MNQLFQRAIYPASSLLALSQATVDDHGTCHSIPGVNDFAGMAQQREHGILLVLVESSGPPSWNRDAKKIPGESRHFASPANPTLTLRFGKTPTVRGLWSNSINKVLTNLNICFVDEP